jgi:hypothetical protein
MTGKEIASFLAMTGKEIASCLAMTGKEIASFLADWDNIELDAIPVKIGVTTGDIDSRMKKLQTGNGSELHLMSYFETEYPFRLEKMLHNHYRKNLKRGEWYIFTDADALGFRSKCEELQHLIDFLKRENPFF